MSSVAFGPANHAGQATAWARALAQGRHSAFSFAVDKRPRPLGGEGNPLGFDCDRRLPYPKITTAWGRARRVRRIARDISHLFLDGFVPAVGSHAQGLTLAELEFWHALDVEVALVAHGSDVRDPRRHVERLSDSYFVHMDQGLVCALQVKAARNREIAHTAGLPVLVSTPDLKLDLPQATWLPLTVDPGRWASPKRPHRQRPRILHVPSSAIKGSDVVDPALEELARRGAIEYVRPQRVSQHDMPALLASVDVVVDQVRTGSYGVAAVEGMFSGAVVVGTVLPEVRELLPTSPPIHDAPASTFMESFGELMDQRENWPEQAERGLAYATSLHSGSAARTVLETVIQSA